MNHLNYTTVRYHIAFRTKVLSVQYSELPATSTDSRGREILAETFTPWRLYSRHSGVFRLRSGAYPDYALPALNDKIKKLSKRHPKREYKIVEVTELRNVVNITEE